jgi:hypothetical protein
LRQRTRPRDGQHSAIIGHALDGQVSAACARSPLSPAWSTLTLHWPVRLTRRDGRAVLRRISARHRCGGGLHRTGPSNLAGAPTHACFK